MVPCQDTVLINWSRPEVSLRILLLFHQQVWWVTAFNLSSTLVQWVSSVRATNYTKLRVSPVCITEIHWCRISCTALLLSSLRFSFFTTPWFRHRRFNYVPSLPSLSPSASRPVVCSVFCCRFSSSPILSPPLLLPFVFYRCFSDTKTINFLNCLYVRLSYCTHEFRLLFHCLPLLVLSVSTS